jgi:hypothetical protein
MKPRKTPEELRASRNGKPRSYKSDPATVRKEVEEWCAEDPHYRQIVEAIRDTLRARDGRALQAH